MDCSNQAPLSMGFSRQKHWSGLPCTPPGDLHDPGIEPCLLHWQVGSLPPNQQGSLGLIVQFDYSVVSDSLHPMDCSMPGLPVHHQLPEFIQTHVHGIGDAIQPSHPLPSPSPPTFSLSQHQDFFSNESVLHTGGQSVGVSASASVLPMNIQD